MKIHKTCQNWGMTHCGLDLWKSAWMYDFFKTTTKWDRVTCKNCLKLRRAKK